MRLSGERRHGLGQAGIEGGTNFALFSANARRSSCACSTARAAANLERIELPERTEDVWHGYLNSSFRRASSMATASTALRRTTATASIPTSCCSTPMPLLAGRLVSDAHFGYRHRQRTRGPVV